jgi:hypothetical protein
VIGDSNYKKHIQSSREAGLCYGCPRDSQRRAAAKAGLCVECYDAMKTRAREWQKRTRDAARAAGHCYRCPPKAPTPAVKAGFCQYHYDDMTKRNAASKKRRSEENVTAISSTLPETFPLYGEQLTLADVVELSGKRPIDVVRSIRSGKSVERMVRR